MPEPSISERSEEFQKLKKKALLNINNIYELAVLLKNLRCLETVTLEEKVELMLVVFTSESKTPKYELMTYLWNFMKILYNDLNKLVLKLIPTIAIDRHSELTEKQVILLKEITTRLYYVMVYLKDSNAINIEIMCKNVLVLSKYLLKQNNHREFFNLATESFFNPKHFYYIRLFANTGEHSPAHDLFLEHYLTRLWEFREFTGDEVGDSDGKQLESKELMERLFQMFLFYLDYESRHREATGKYALTDKLISVLLNMQLVKGQKELCNSVKCLYAITKLMKAGESQEGSVSVLYQYMGRICEKSILNTSPYAADALATVAIVLERNPYFQEEKNIRTMPLECTKYLLYTIKLTVGMSVEPEKIVCELKDCVKGGKKHTITNLTRFAQRVFLSYASQVGEANALDEELLATVTQLIIFHFHVLERLNCPSRIANEHNDVRRLYSTFAHRLKSKPQGNVLKIFEIVFKYTLQRNLAALVSPISTLLIKFYAQTNDQVNGDRMEWFNFLRKYKEQGEHRESSSGSSGTSFEDCCHNWAVKKQKLTKEELTPLILTMRDTALDYTTEIIPTITDPNEVLLRILETVAVLNYKAFRVLQECLVEIILSKWTDDCSEEVVNLLFHATESQILDYKSAIENNLKFFEEKKQTKEFNVPLAVLYSLDYQVYNVEMRQTLKPITMTNLQAKEATLNMMTMTKENEQLDKLKKSLDHLRKITTIKQLPDQRCVRQVVGTLKRSIRYFQLAGLEFEEVACCKMVYDLSKECKDVEGCLLAMANLMNHVHFIIKDDRCVQEFPKLIKTINGEGSQLLVSHLMQLEQAKESLQVLIVFGIGNMIKLNADLGKREKSYEYLCILKDKIVAAVGSSARPDPQTEQSVNELQYDLISFQLYLKYAPQSKVNPLMVVRKIFSAVRLLHKVSDLYALYLYDVLVELFCFSLPRYETKGLDFYICTLFKYFTGIGSVTRIVDVLLIQANWALCCETVEKGVPIMECIAEVLSTDPNTSLIPAASTDEQKFLSKMKFAISSVNAKSSVWLAIVAFKLNCLLARKFYIDQEYDQSRICYEEAWNAYESLSERIMNYSLKIEFQQFYVNALFQLSNVYYKLGMATKSFRFCEQTTVMISEILVNRIALTQEAYFQELAFKREVTTTISNKTVPGHKESSPVDALVLEMSLVQLQENKVAPKSIRIKKASSKESTPSQSKRGKRTSIKTPAKIKLEPRDNTFTAPALPAIVDENSSVLGNQAPATHAQPQPTADEPRRRATSTTTNTTSTRKIPVRTSSSIKTVTKPKRTTTTTTTTGIQEDTSTPSTQAVGTRKTSRRLI